MDASGAVRQGVGFWGWLIRLVAVAGITLAGAFYFPLYRAHKELTQEYAALNQRAQKVDREIGVIKTELGAAKAKRDELEARRGMDQSRERASRELVEQIKSDLASAAEARAAAAVAPKTPQVAVGWKPFFWCAMRAGPALMALPTRLITS